MSWQSQHRMELLRDNAQVLCDFPSFSSVSHVCSRRGIWRRTRYPGAHKYSNLHTTRKLHPTDTVICCDIDWHRCRERQLLHAPASPPAPGLLLKLPRPVTDLLTWCSTRGLTRSQPEVIWPWAFFSCDCCGSHLHLHAVNIFLRDSDTNWQTLEITFYGRLPFCLTPSRTEHPLWGIWGIASCSPLPSPQIWKTSSGNFQPLSYTSE